MKSYNSNLNQLQILLDNAITLINSLYKNIYVITSKLFRHTMGRNVHDGNVFELKTFSSCTFRPMVCRMVDVIP